MQKEISDLTEQLNSMTATQKHLHKENVNLRKSIKHKQSELEKLQRESTKNDLQRARNAEFEETVTLEKNRNEKLSEEIRKLKTRLSSEKQELLQAQQHADGLQVGLDETRTQLQASSTQVHSLQRDLKEKEEENDSMHRTLQRFMKEQQDTLEEMEELKKELSSKERDQQETRNRLQKQSTTLYQQKEEEISRLTRELQEMTIAKEELKMDNESLREQLKRVQADIADHQVRVKEMEQTLVTQQEEKSVEKEAHTETVSFSNHSGFGACILHCKIIADTKQHYVLYLYTDTRPAESYCHTWQR